MKNPIASNRVCGLDEAGRGAWAGPLVAAAVILPCTKNKITRRAKTKFRDGKLLNEKQRRRMYAIVKRLKAQIFVEIISARQINNHGIGWANKEIFRKLIKKIDADSYIIDGKIKIGKITGKTDKIKSIIDADAKVPEVMMAGIVAKVERDKLMAGLHKQFPVYRWKDNAGYGTKQHLAAIGQFGTSHIHRSIYVTTAERHRKEVNELSESASQNLPK